jgi:hypothetical protein
MPIVLNGTTGITTPDLASGPVAGTTANFSGNVTLGSSVLATPSGSAPSYTCRAWVNFNGTTSPGTIRASGNVSSVTRNGTGDYTVNFTTAMPDVNYAVAGNGNNNATGGFGWFVSAPYNTAPTTSAIRLIASGSAGFVADFDYVYISIFR